MKKITFKKPICKKVIRIVVILVVIAAGIFYFVGRQKPKSEAQQVFTAQAGIGRVEVSISGKGTLNPADQYEVKSLVKGEILSAPFEEGDTVKEGQLLYQISTDDIENMIKSAQLNVDKSRLSYQRYLEKQTELTVYAKESGYINKLYVKKGELLQAGTTIADIFNGKNMYIDLLFPSYEVKKSWVGKAASLSMDATGEALEGKVTAVSDMEETLEGGILAKKVTICVTNATGIKVGDLAEASVSDIASCNIGSFRAETQEAFISESSGRIEQLFVKEGDWVKKGDKILSLSSGDLDDQIKSADLGIKEAELNLKTQKDQMDQYTIKAPISGEVITKNKKQGDTIDPAIDTQAGPMAIIYDLTNLTFEMNIDELQMSSIKVGQKVSIHTDNFPEAAFEGVVEKISLKGITNNSVTSYPVTVKMDEYGNLLPGMNVTARIILEEADNVLTVPSSALQRGDLVYVQTEGAAPEEGSGIPEGFQAVPVEVGLNDGSNVEIKSGLKEGDTVYVPFDSNAAVLGGDAAMWE